eukprot:TRINITY_DN1492_c0_g1_i1.p1 TRINITY_DN1492_c0_g1~~TRINITY_DN1492_c0_g1_i1.p1  ORF type:complete len:490 (+),score=103.89 TRINITY_DN1492_c0_g1_i1:64-1533(+)
MNEKNDPAENTPLINAIKSDLEEEIEDGQYSLILLWIIIILGLIEILLIHFNQNKTFIHALIILLLAVLLWITEWIPSFTTALFIPLLGVIFKVIPEKSAAETGEILLAPFFDQLIVLFLGAFVLSNALEKQKIDQILSNILLKVTGLKVPTFLFGIMVLAVLLSSVISNVTAAVICLSICKGIFLFEKRKNVQQALLFGVAFASNIGGMTSPIASPQNAIALDVIVNNTTTKLGFIKWISFAFPLCLIYLIIVWLILIVFTKVRKLTFPPIVQPKIVPSKEFWFVLFVGIVTIFCWCLAHELSFLFGSLGVIALIPIVVFFSVKSLKTADFNKLQWSPLIVMGGGLSLAKILQLSGLLDLCSKFLGEKLNNASLYVVTIAFTLFLGVMGNVISSTIAAALLLNLVVEVCEHCSVNPVIPCLSSVFITSGAMTLPVSSFPNLSAYSLGVKNEEDPVFNGATFIKTGFFTTVCLLILQCSCAFFFLSLFF